MISGNKMTPAKVERGAFFESAMISGERGRGDKALADTSQYRDREGDLWDLASWVAHTHISRVGVNTVKDVK